MSRNQDQKTVPTEPVIGQLAPARQAAAELGIPYTSLRDLAFAGRIPVIRVGRAWYFDREDLRRLVSSSKLVLK